MTKAEEKAIAYQLATHGPNVIGGGAILSDEEHKYWNINYDFLAGYEEAEEDLGLTWEDVSLLNNIRTEEINRIVSESKDGIIFTDNDELSKIVLKKFNKIKGNE